MRRTERSSERQSCGRRSAGRRTLVALLTAAALASGPAAAQVIVQEFYVPLPAVDVRIWADAIQDLVENETMTSIISLTVTANSTVIYYDHWENGYEIDPTMPLAPFTGAPNDPGTQIWGDGNAANGAPPGFPGDVLTAGDVIILDSDVPLGPTSFRDPAQIFFDGRDKFVTTEPLAVTRASWPSTGVEAQLGGAVEVFDTERWGTFFEAPVGENAGPTAFEFVAFAIMAQEDGTTVDVDFQGDGTPDVNLVLDQGEHALVGAPGVTDLLVGATVTASTNVQVDLITANEGTTYEGRWYSLVPTARWGNLYFSPVASTVSGDLTHVYLYNPNPGTITVTVDQTTGCTDVVVPSGAEVEVALAITTPRSAARFESDGTNCAGGAAAGGNFFAIATIDRNQTIHDWGFTLIPEASLTPNAVVGWAPGSTDNSQNANPVWVTAVDPMGGSTTLYVDLDGDPTTGPLTDPFGNMYDFTVPISNLQSIQIFDGNSDPPPPYPPNPTACVGGDCDQTGLRIYTVDGTRITAAWGQNPFWAYSGEPVQLDMGTTVLPFSSLTAFKDAALLDANGNGGLDPGEGILYTIRIRNVGIIPITDIDVVDTLDPNTTYVPESTERDGVPIPDDLAGTPFPLDNSPVATGYPLVVSPATLDPGDEIVLTFVVVANDPLPVNVSEVVNSVQVSSDAEIFLDTESTPVVRGDLVVTKVSDTGGADVVPGQTITYTITATNTSGATITGVRLLDALPAGTTYVSESTVVTGPRQIYVQDLFEARSFGNNNGPSTWEAAWVENDPPGADAGPVAGNIQVAAGRLQFSGAPTGHSLAREVDLGAIAGAGATAFLTFDYDTTGNLEEAFDILVVEASAAGGGGPFTVLRTFDGDLTVGPQTIELSGFVSANTTIRFRVTNGLEFGETAFIDNLAIRATASGSTASHDFATANYSAGTGWAGPWTETNDNGLPATGSIRITGGELLLEGSGGNPERIIERQVNLSNAAFAFFSFNWRCVGDMEIGQDFVHIEAFDDNTSTWVTLQTKEGEVDMCLEPGDNDAGSEVFRLDDSVLLSANTRIRFRYTISAAAEDFFVDNVRIRAANHVVVTKDNVPAGGNEDLLDGVPSNLTVPDDDFALRPGETVTATFQVTVDIPPLVPNVVNTVSVTAFEVPVPRTATVLDRLLPGAAIGDTVWLDTDRDGILDVGEPGLANVRVWLDVNANGMFDPGVDRETTTNANGEYVFAGLSGGTYQVFVDEATLPAPLVIAPGSVNPYPPVTLPNKGRFFDADFGYTSPPDTAVIGDWVWHDTDGDGIQDPGEIGVPGVLMNLYDPATMMVVATTTTGPDGRYYFAGVNPGEYVVEIDATNFNPGGALDPAAGWVVTMGPQSEGSNRSNPVTVIGGDVVTEIDFGYRNPNFFSISDFVWIDSDGDGIFDPTESGIPGVTVSLLDDPDGIPNNGDESVIGTATSAADGSFTFSGVPDGDYIIRIDDIMDLLEDFTGTTPAAVNANLPVTVSGGPVNGINFGYNAPGQIGDLVWSDDGDGVFEVGEPGIPGVLVNLIDPASMTVVDSVVTGADGSYVFTGVDPGAYVVEIDASNFLVGGALEGATQTADPSEFGMPCSICNNRGSTSVAVDTSDFNQDFGYNRPALPDISGTVFEDFDRDGVEEPGEPGVAGVTVALIPTFTVIDGRLDVNGDGMIDATDDGFADGVAVIDGRLDVDGDGMITAADDGLFNGVAVIDGELDFDGDGMITAADDGTVEGPPIATTTTDAMGDYSFVDVPEGTYEVRVTDSAKVLDGHTLTSGLDSIPITAVAGMDITDIDFGYIRDEARASIGDRVWFDADRDGVQDAGEGGISGVTLDLIDVGPDGILGTGDDLGVVATTTTDANGSYVFAGLDSGNYVVDLTDTGMVLTALVLTGGADPTATISLSEGEDYNDADFGYGSMMGVTAIGDTVWYDTDGDGFEDPGELGIPGVTVRIIDPGPDGAIGTGDDVGVVGTTTTDAQGHYLFTGYSSASNRVYVEVDTTTLPPGYNTTPTNGNAQRPFDITPGIDILFADFGFNGGTTGTIGDKVYLDGDGDGMQDPLEPGLGGVTINLVDDATGTVVATTVTGDGTVDVNGDGMVDDLDLGFYEFSGIPPGNYNVVITDIFTVLADLNPTETPTLPIMITAAGEAIDTADFGYAPSEGTGTIGGTVWHDKNQTMAVGILDPDETGVEGVTVELWLDTNGNGVIEPGIDNLIRMATTDENGDYAFLGIPFGDYLVDVTDDAGVLTGMQNVLGPTPGADNNGQTDPYAVTLDLANSSNFTADFGYEAISPQVLTGTAFFDVNGDGIRDLPQDFGVAGVRMFLYRDLDGDMVLDPGEPLFGSTLVSDGTVDVDGDMMIDPAGYYAFVDLPDGDYIVVADPRQSFVDGLEQTTQLAPPQPQGGIQPATIMGAPSTGNDFGFTARTTAVVLSGFEAEVDAGGVRVRWETASQSGTVGFYLYRLDEEAGWVQVNERLLPAILDAPQGAVYELVDRDAPSRVDLTYSLVEVEAAGAERVYGPFRPRLDARPVIAKAASPDGSQAVPRRRSERMEQRLAAMKAEREAMAATRTWLKSGRLPTRPGRQPLASDLRLKIEIERDGLYVVTADEIATALEVPVGPVRAAIRTGGLRLTSGGAEVAWRAYGNALSFFGTAIDSPYARYNVYWLELGRGVQMDAAAAGGVVGGATSFAETARFEHDVFSVTIVPDSPIEDFYYWAFIMAGDPGSGQATLTLDVADPVAAGTARLGVHLQGVTSTPASIDHRAVARLNGVEIGATEWNGAAPHQVFFDLPADLVTAGANTLEIEGVLAGLPYSTFLVDSVELAYERSLTAVEDRLLFSTETAGPVEVSGFSSAGIELYDVSSPQSPVLLVGAVESLGEGWTIGFTAAEGGRYLAVGAAGAESAAALRPRSKPRLGAIRDGVDYVVIAPAELAAAAQSLVDYRSGFGLSGRVVELEAIQDVLAHGLATPVAVRDFLAWAWAEWATRPRFAVLAGGGTFDYKGVQGIGGNLVPPLMTATPYGLFASDSLFGDVEGGDSVPEIAVGRIPALTAAELEAYVAKMAAYETAGGASGVLLVADDGDDAGDFPAASDALEARLPAGVASTKVYLSEHSVADARQMIFDAVATGVGAVNYLGHGGLNRLADEGLLLSSDAEALVGHKLPVFATLTCSVGRFEVPGFESLAEALVMAPDGGAAVVFAPTGQSLNFEAVEMNKAWIDALFAGSGTTVGEAAVTTLGYEQATDLPFMRQIFNLLGDPAFGVD